MICKKFLWSCNDWKYKEKVLIINILVNNKVKDLKFYYVVANNIIDIPINFLMNWCILEKVTPKLI